MVADELGHLPGRVDLAAQDVVVGLLVRLGFLVALVFAVAPAPEHHKADQPGKVLLPVLPGGKEFAVAVFQAAPVLLAGLVLTKWLLRTGLMLEQGQEFGLIVFDLQAVVIARFNDSG